MKIVFLSDDFPPMSFGGAGISTYELATGVRRVGNEVHVITTCRNEQDAGSFEMEGMNLVRIATEYDERWRAWISLYNPSTVRQVKAVLEKLQPDVVHVNNVHQYLSYYCLKLAKRHAKAVVWTARDVMAVSYGKLATERYLHESDAHLSWLDLVRQSGKRYNPLRNFFIKKYLGYADLKLAVSEALSRVLASNGITDVQVLHTGIDAEAWHISDTRITAFKKRYGIEHKKVVLFGGRLGAGVQAVNAMQAVAASVSNAVLLVMGREESAKSMKDLSKDLPILYTGWISGEEKMAAYLASDVVWVPSTYFDSFPRSALEASVASKPVIVTKYGGASELVVHGKTGYVVDPFNSQEMGRYTIELLQDREKALAYGRAGYARVRADFSLEKNVRELIDRYTTLLAKRP